MTAEAKTRATPPPPPRKQSSFLAPSATEERAEAANNMKAEKLVGMTFNMPRDWHTRFKMTAVSRGLDMKEFLMECFATWEKAEREKAK
ncbi:hypothetical protein SAMN05216358_0039 [Rhizobium sp. AN5]|uniref:hypothetical protein n=1 Tax=Rhizobium sp. AN5 TaxID=1855304 RepID=UPI000BCCF4EA|nr:hypothetical protein [Rhizobium sp. AN5]SOC90023.1 hypothetical protein SAMN05216358_0039 [Rhizobium sp. AN5]